MIIQNESQDCCLKCYTILVNHILRERHKTKLETLLFQDWKYSTVFMKSNTKFTYQFGE